MIEKSGSAVWSGGLKAGSGTVSTESGALDGIAYSHASRFEGKAGCNPEELIGAAHAACYAMFLSALMEGAGIKPGTIATTSTVTLDATTEGGPTVVAAHLVATVTGDAPEEKLLELAEQAKAGCPISKLLRAEVTLEVSVG
ncbi:OsmC family peroxiredoxin [Acidimangrovimonas pyrenivorans]|uniref:OsmC family peroxiredoxin n=1 Tax=Acidimangrovimonas pyrenivorans TaxID=2030798 RepID=A0ABV7AEK3_9RHOB